jgi:hypothetical protein
LSLAPLTAPVAMTLRLGLVEVPAWQVGLSLLGVWAGFRLGQM